MSSTLDDLEPSEFFQMDLDAFLKKYEATKVGFSVKERIILNTFIEYVCFIKSIEGFDKLTNQLVEIDFPKHLHTLFPDTYSKTEIQTCVTTFLDWIKEQ